MPNLQTTDIWFLLLPNNCLHCLKPQKLVGAGLGLPSFLTRKQVLPVLVVVRQEGRDVTASK
jgi:hypothetical protein